MNTNESTELIVYESEASSEKCIRLDFVSGGWGEADPASRGMPDRRGPRWACAYDARGPTTPLKQKIRVSENINQTLVNLGAPMITNQSEINAIIDSYLMKKYGTSSHAQEDFQNRDIESEINENNSI